MRVGRWLILAVLLGTMALVARVYLQRKASIVSETAPPPEKLDHGLGGRQQDWEYTQTDASGKQARFKVWAKNMRQIDSPPALDLEGVRIHLFHADGKKYDVVDTDHALFNENDKSLFSEGAVEITMAVPDDEPDKTRVLKIHTTGARFDSVTGKAETDRPATFEFDNGSGSSNGADYDPMTRHLHLHKDAVIDWQGKTADAKPVHVESGEAMYLEDESKVMLYPWSRLSRDVLTVEGGLSVVTIDKGEIRKAEVVDGKGVQDDSVRRVEFAAKKLNIDYGAKMAVQKIEGIGAAKIVSQAPTGKTTINSDRADLDFKPSGSQSVLTQATTTGNSVAESVPTSRPGATTPDTRVLRSETIHMVLRDGGRELDNADTPGPGTLEFIPSVPTGPRRYVRGDRLWVVYGSQNRMQSFRTINANTRTEQQGKPAVSTDSKELTAAFDPNSGELTRIDQRTDFHYQEADRQARADRAVLEQATGIVTMDGAVRASDSSGATSADHIVMNRTTGDKTAEGNVSSIHEPDKSGKPNSSAMMSSGDPMQGRGRKMIMTEKNQHIRYEGAAKVWQGTNRVEGDVVDIDRSKHSLEAHGHVISQLVEKPKPDSTAAPALTTVRSDNLRYTDEDRLAYYTGSVQMRRPDMDVTSSQLRAFLKDDGDSSTLDRAVADGTVKIHSSRKDAATQTLRTRTGDSEHSEYYADEGRVLLTEGHPIVIDSVKGRTEGDRITFYVNDDRIQVAGQVEKRVETNMITRSKTAPSSTTTRSAPKSSTAKKK